MNSKISGKKSCPNVTFAELLDFLAPLLFGGAIQLEGGLMHDSAVQLFLKAIGDLPDWRAAQGKRYCLGLLLFALLVAEAAGKQGQREKARWLSSNWGWICEEWCAATDLPAWEDPPSQPTLSRILRHTDARSFLKKLSPLEEKRCEQLAWEIVRRKQRRMLKPRRLTAFDLFAITPLTARHAAPV